MSEEQRREVEQSRDQARLSGEKFEKIFQATEPKVPRGPMGRPAESFKERKIPVEKLEHQDGPRERPERILVIRRKTIIKRQQSPAVGSSKGVTIFRHKKPLIQSSGRISRELPERHAERLAHLREQVQAHRNRKELRMLETVWAKTRAQMTAEQRAESRP
jgi:hypothetical protein